MKEFLGQFKTGHLRHCLVCHNDVEPVRVLTKNLQGLGAVRERRHLEADTFQYQFAGPCIVLSIVNKEDPTVSLMGQFGLFMRFLRGRREVNDREIDGKLGALPRPALYGNGAFMAHDDPVYPGKSQAGPFSLFFGCEVGIEDALPGKFIHAMSGIAYGQADKFPAFEVSDFAD